MNDDPIRSPQSGRRKMLASLCVVGASVGVARYLGERPQPPSGSPVAADFSDLPPGKLRVLDWQGRTLWILRRTAEEVSALADQENELIDPHGEHSLQPENCRNRHRSLHPDVFVAIGQCTHQAARRNCAAGRASAASSCAPAMLRSLIWPDASSAADRRQPTWSFRCIGSTAITASWSERRKPRWHWDGMLCCRSVFSAQLLRNSSCRRSMMDTSRA